MDAQTHLCSFPGERIDKGVYVIGHATITLKQLADDDIQPGSPSGIELRTIKVPAAFRRQGGARNALVRVADWADATHAVLYLCADPFDDQPMTALQLRRFYSRFAFRPYKGRIMRRMPLRKD
jgi:hypothetical protein